MLKVGRLMLRAVRRPEEPESVDENLWMQMNNYYRPEQAQEALAYQPYAATKAY